MNRTPYEILGVKRDCSMKEIKKAYKELSLRYHPDVSRDSGENFRAVNEAYKLLSDPELKEIYDNSGESLSRQAIEHEAKQELLSIITAIVSNIRDLETDAKQIIEDELNRMLYTFKESTLSLTSKREKIELFLSKISFEDIEDFVSQRFGLEIDLIESQIATNNKNTLIYEKASEILKSIKYDYEVKTEESISDYFNKLYSRGAENGN